MIDSQEQVEAVLRGHAGVRDAAVVGNEDGTQVALVVADGSYLREIAGYQTAQSGSVAKWRKVYDLSQRTKEAEEAPVGFNTAGWASSYTREPIPAAEMAEWVDTTVADILRLKPRKVYEIGCGSGLLLMRIARACESYVGNDFAPAVLERLRAQLQSTSLASGAIRTEERTADDFSGVAAASVDTVILSSVIQYFPSREYLTTVLEGAAKILEPGGRIYVGDVRNLLLGPSFAGAVELFRAPEEITVDALRGLIQKRLIREQELLVSPAYFLGLRRQIPAIAEVEIRPLRGQAVNEMTQYRYQAILHVEEKRGIPTEVKFKHWPEHKWTAHEIGAMLRDRPKEILGVRRIANARIEKDMLAMRLLSTAGSSSSVGDLQRKMAECTVEGINPQELLDLERDNPGFRVFLSWAAGHADGSFDACFAPEHLIAQGARSSIQWPMPDESAAMYLTNHPSTKVQRKELARQLTEYCRERLPAELAPATIALVDGIPQRSGVDLDADGLLKVRSAAAWI